MERIPDEMLEYYADLFIEKRIREQGVTFERFLELPEAYLKRNYSPRQSRSYMALLLLLGAAVLSLSCSNASDPGLTASGFVDQSYVKVDLPRAKRLTDGLATRKFGQEQTLLQGVKAGEGAKHRHVSYRLLEKRDEGEHVFFVYDLVVKSRGVPVLKKRSLIAVGKVGDAWRVTNFRDFDS